MLIGPEEHIMAAEKERQAEGVARINNALFSAAAKMIVKQNAIVVNTEGSEVWEEEEHEEMVKAFKTGVLGRRAAIEGDDSDSDEEIDHFSEKSFVAQLAARRQGIADYDSEEESEESFSVSFKL